MCVAVWLSILPPIVLGVGFIALWQAWVEIKDVKPFIIPKPTAIIEASREDPDLVVKASIVTGVNALVGLVVGFGTRLRRRGPDESVRVSSATLSTRSR